MKKLFALILLLLSFSALLLNAQVANVTYWVTNVSSAASITLTPLSSTLYGTYLVTSGARTLPLVGTNSATFTNVAMGFSYQVLVKDVYYHNLSAWTNQFPITLSGNINGGNWIFYSFIQQGGGSPAGFDTNGAASAAVASLNAVTNLQLIVGFGQATTTNGITNTVGSISSPTIVADNLTGRTIGGLNIITGNGSIISDGGFSGPGSALSGLTAGFIQPGSGPSGSNIWYGQFIGNDAGGTNQNVGNFASGGIFPPENGNNITNLNAGNLLPFTKNNIYYFDAYATNSISVPNNPLTPYHYFDQVNTAVQPSPPTFIVGPGIYYFNNPMTNVNFIGSGVGNTVIVDTNILGSLAGGIDGYEMFDIATSNLTLSGFTCGAIPGGLNDLTNYTPFIWTSPNGPEADNITIQNVNEPLSLASFGITNGGASLYCIYLNSTNNVLNWTFNNINIDTAQDDFHSNVHKTNTITFIGCNFTGRGLTNPGNLGGQSLCIDFDQPGPANGSMVNVLGCSLSVLSTNSSGNCFRYSMGNTSFGTNIVVNLQNDFMTNLSGSDFLFKGSALHTNGLGAYLSIVGGIYDSNPISYDTTFAQQFWSSNLTFNYQDKQGNVYKSGMDNSLAVRTGNMANSNLLSFSSSPTIVSNGTYVGIYTFIPQNNNDMELMWTNTTTTAANTPYFTIILSGGITTTNKLHVTGNSCEETNVFGINVGLNTLTQQRFLIMANPNSPSNSLIVTSSSGAPIASTAQAISFHVVIPTQ